MRAGRRIVVTGIRRNALRLYIPGCLGAKVFGLALWGDFTLTAAQLLPIVLLIWLTPPTHRFDGTEVTSREAPDFFARWMACARRSTAGAWPKLARRKIFLSDFCGYCRAGQIMNSRTGKEADRYAARVENADKHAGRARDLLNDAPLKGDVQASALDAIAKSLLCSAAQADE